MPTISIRIDLQPKRVVVTMRGEVSPQDVAVALEMLFDESHLSAGVHLLWDLRNAQISVLPKEIPSIISAVSERLSGRWRGRTAVVTNRDVDYGTVRVAQVYLEDLRIELMVFRAMAEAEQWLAGEGDYQSQWPATRPDRDNDTRAG
ncbi:MAG: hypothetical protein AMS18_13130 [Gemmatimonas sp. SG8_17]|nr:MAG: hypothetical protein AMS18_13130 [Gemmatimonas sp. SG8_17]